MDTDTPAKDSDYKVGYKRPPREHCFKKGNTGNLKGRPKAAGSTVREWWNTMAEWPREKIEAAAEDETATAAKRAAALNWLNALSKMFNNAGTPICGAEIDRIVENTAGKPVQPVESNSTVQHEHHHTIDYDSVRRHIASRLGMGAGNPHDHIAGNGN